MSERPGMTPFTAAPPPEMGRAVDGEEAVAKDEPILDNEEAPWHRLDPRMLLVHPVVEVVRYLPVLAGIVLFGSAGDGDSWWQLVAIAIPVLIGLMRYATTRFRVTDETIELRRGLVSRRVLTARLDRIRTVQLAASPIHRLLGLAKIQIRTAQASTSDGGLTLDSLPRRRATGLRERLVRRETGHDVSTDRAPADEEGDAENGVIPGVVDDAATDPRGELLLRLNPRWMRYAPLTISGLVILAPIAAVAGRFMGQIIETIAADTNATMFARLPVWAWVVMAVAAVVMATGVLSIVGYLVSFWGFTLRLNRGEGRVDIRHGLTTTRETSVDLARVRGVQLHEPIGLRSAGAARAIAIVTGMGADQGGSAPLSPPAPRGECERVATELIDDNAVTMPLITHGPRATLRRFSRAGVVAAVLLAGWWILAAQLDWGLGGAAVGLIAPVVAGLTAHDRARRLGHALTRDHVIGRAGCFRGRRTVLAREGIIGWTMRQSLFQRRAGLTTLIATTSAGRQGYAIPDIPVDDATALAYEASGGLWAPFLVSAGAATSAHS